MRKTRYTFQKNYVSPRVDYFLSAECDDAVLFSSPMGGDGTEDSHSDDDGSGGEYEFDW